MAGYQPPQPEQSKLMRAILARAAEQYGPSGDAPSLIDDTIANRARLLIAAVNEFPEEQQPVGWVTAADPHAEVAYKKDQLQVLNKLLGDRERELHQNRSVIARTTVAWDSDAVRLWCNDCPDHWSPIATLPVYDAPLADVWNAVVKHRTERHVEES